MNQTQILSPGPTMNSAPELVAEASSLTIADYQLQERIGMGGFGEVWRAIGPGGFAKAVKILFGSVSGPQAETELNSLHRIRDLRHPFLLSIDRIEIAGGRVVIVTELADRSLERRFAEAVEQGQRGIPRDELLGYLRDAADALDFMSEQHGLQHLDIKPENLFLQGSHVKVGDFGLTKHLASCGQSLVTGFTPLYAAPELFDGRADRATDQYSLAIVYQMMLTGAAPFNGRTPAQLTSQHLKSPPDLSGLHPSDRAVVARALSKNPRSRFAGCRQFVDELLKRRFGAPALRRDGDPADPDPPKSLTAIVDATAVGRNDSQLLPPATPRRPVSVTGFPLVMRPTVFVGLGGMGSKVVELLQQKCQALYPDAALPSLQFLCIDTDPEASARATAERTADNRFPTTIAIPLRTSHEYRKRSADHLNWLSRRWLFNIPRSGRVEGLRPLGRLAFVDHQEEIRERLRLCLQSATQAASVRTTAEETNLPFTAEELDVVLIGSTSGGTGSGSLIDAAWLVRSLRNEKQLPRTRVASVMLHGTAPGRQTADMQDANTISFLKELNYFCLPGVQCPVNARRSGHAESALPFDDAWLLHLGDELSGSEFHKALESVADYLELRTLSPARREMDVWREPGANGKCQEHELFLRTFGLAKVSEDAWGAAHTQATHLCRGIICRWLSAGQDDALPGALAHTANEVSQLVNNLAISSEGVIQLVPKLLNAERSRRLNEYASGVISRLAQESVGEPNTIGQITELITRDMAAGASVRSEITVIVDEVRRDLASGLSRAVSQIEKHIQQCLDGGGRLQAAERSLAALLRSADNAITAGAAQKNDLEHIFAELFSTFSFGEADVADSALRAFNRQYCMLLACQLTCQCVSVHMKSLRESLQRLRDEKLSALRIRVKLLSGGFETSPMSGTPLSDLLPAAFDEFLVSQGRFRLSLLQHQDVRPTDTSTLTSDAANFLLMTVSHGASSTAGAADRSVSTTFPGNARPPLRNVGGGQRVVAAVPQGISPETWLAQLQNEFGQCVSVVSMNREDICVFCETEGIAISAVIDSFSHLKPKVVELAGRLHSRQDIPW